MSETYYTESRALNQGQSFLPVDRAIVAISVVLVVCGFVLYHVDLLGLTGLRNLTPVAKISSLDADSRRKIPGTLSWVDADAQDVLYNGDQILTTDASSVTVAFDQGGQLLIGPNSLIRIEVTDGKFEVALVKGSVAYDTNGTTGSAISVRDSETGRALALRPGEDVTLSRDGFLSSEQRKRGELENGSANRLRAPAQGSVINPSVTRTLDLPLTQPTSGTLYLMNGDGVTVREVAVSDTANIRLPVPEVGRYTARLVSSTGDVIGKTAFRVVPFETPALAAVPDQTIFLGESVPLTWPAVDGKEYELTVTTPSGATVQRVSGGAHALRPDVSGDYTVRLALIDGEKRYQSEPRSFRMTVKEGLVLPAAQLLQNVPQGASARFDVTSPVPTAQHTFEVSRSADFAEILQTIRTPIPQVAIPMVSSGVYYVRARAQGPAPLTSQVAKVVVKASVAKTTKSYAPSQPLAPDKAEATLSWKKNPAVDELRLQVAKDDNFQDLLHDRVTNKESERVPVPGLGRYFWRLLPIDGAPEFIGPSEPYVLSMETLAAPRVPGIIPQQVLQYDEDAGTPSYQIQLLPYADAVAYELEVFSDVRAKHLVFKKKSPKPVVEWTSNRSGRYYYRMRVEDKWGRLSPYSQLGELIFPISPMVEL